MTESADNIGALLSYNNPTNVVRLLNENGEGYTTRSTS